jgi:integrase
MTLHASTLANVSSFAADPNVHDRTTSTTPARLTRKRPDNLVFGNRSRGPLRESKVLRNVLQPAAEAAGLGRVTWHQFRHIHSSLLNKLRVPVKIAQEQLGHASISTTPNIYTHVVDKSHRSAIEAVERELFPSVPQSENSLDGAVPVSDSVN